MEDTLKKPRYMISDEIFAQFPGYVRGVVVANGVDNTNSNNDLKKMLRDAEHSLRNELNIENLTEHPQINSWREAFRSFGAKPGKFRSSIEAMTRRVLREEELPSINPLVDIGNILSLRHLVPTGGHAIDDITEDISLRHATGEEEFIPFGSDKMEHPLPGEIIFTEGNTVLTRRWSWRQAKHTLTLPTTKAIEFNIDGLPPVTINQVESICKELMDMIDKFCGGKIRYHILDQNNPTMELFE
jgi:DNA/RNA-binding domain of Phe-tRNA-synthetase-like protein